MKKLLERLRADSERTRLFASIALVAVAVITAMLLPLAFRSAPAGEISADGLTLEQRCLLFADYWAAGGEGSYTVTKPDPVPRTMRERCETVMRTVIARSIDDAGLTDFSPTGSEYTTVTDSAGRELRLCRMWLERRGDWQNWLDVCFDADTGELYYYYLSRECLTNRQNYPSPSEGADATQIAEMLAADNGWTLRYIAREGDSGATAIFGSGGGTLCYQISCRMYDSLIDIKLTCR